MPSAIPDRIHPLDSLRGLASLQVLIHHCFLISILIYTSFSSPLIKSEEYSLINLLTFSPLHVLWAGQEAVIFFFVLSGFVLSLPYYKNKNLSYYSFLVKRIFRIYFPFLVALFLGFLLNILFHDHSRITNLSSWLNDFYHKPVSVKEVFIFIFRMMGDFHNVVTSLWSLPIEMKISIIFPFVALLLNRLNFAYSILFVMMNAGFYFVGKRLGFQDAVDEFSLFYYLTFFLFGAILSKYQHLVLPYIEKMNTVEAIVLFIVCLLLYTYKWNIQHLPVKLYTYALKVPVDYIISMVSLIIILIGLSQKYGRLLNHYYFVQLGKISFSLYLIHPLIIGIIGFQLGETFPVYVIMALSIIISLILAFPFYYLVESPFQRLGKLVSKNF